MPEDRPTVMEPQPETETENSAGSPEKMDFKTVFRRLGPAGILAVIAASLPVIGGFALLLLTPTIAPWLRDQGSTGVVIYVIAFAVLAGLAVLPTWIQSVVGGFAFQGVVGSYAAMGGIFGASMIGYIIARQASGHRVVELINEQPKWQAVYEAMLRGSYLKTLSIVTLLRVPTNSPFAITNLVLAATRVRSSIYALGTVIGIAPRTIAAVVIGASMSQWDKEQTSSLTLKIVGIVVTIIVFGIIGVMANRAIQKVTGQDEAASASAADPASTEA